MPGSLIKETVAQLPAPSVGAAQSYIEGVYGGPTEEQDSGASVGTTATKLLGNDPERLAVTFINLGSEPVYLMYDDAVSTTRGIVLTTNGGGVSLNVRDDQTLPTREWWALTSTGSSDMVVISTRRYALTGSP